MHLVSSNPSPSDSFKAGGVTANWSQWKNITSDSFVLDLVQGIPVELKELPFQTSLPDSTILNNEGKNKILREKILEMESQGIVEKTSLSKRFFCSRLFLTEKKRWVLETHS